MALDIRPAHKGDAVAVINLLRAFARAENEDPPDDEACERLIADGWGERQRFQTWLVEIDGEVIAFAIVIDAYSTYLARPTLFIEDFFVTPKNHYKGVGTALFRHLAREIQIRGYGRLEWTCPDQNHRAHKFYEKLGGHQLEKQFFRWQPEHQKAAAQSEIILEIS